MAPTGKAVDVALAEGVATERYTMHGALKRLAEGRLVLGPFTWWWPTRRGWSAPRTGCRSCRRRRIHDDTTDTRRERGQDITTVTAARGHQVGVGDVILSRRNDPTVAVYDPTDRTQKSVGRRCATGNAGRW